MKKVVIGLVAGLTLVSVTSVSALAAGGGMSGKVPPDQADFGIEVSALAQEDPGAVADHVRENNPGIMAMPEVDLPDQADFGIEISGIAPGENPGEVADIACEGNADASSVADDAVSGVAADIPDVAMEGGVIAAHVGEDLASFSGLVSSKAIEDPAWLAAHVSGRE